MSRNRTLRDEGVKTAAAQASQLVQRQTCEYCAHLRAIRPMCVNEASPNYRKPRDTHNDGCAWYTVKGQTVKPAAPEAPPASRAEIGGEVSKHKHNRWARGASA